MRAHKSYPISHFKALETEGEGMFEAIVSVFDNVDLVGDRVVKGAFSKNLEEWKSSGDPIPVIFSHQWDNLDAHVGVVTEAEERDEGLYVKGTLDMDEDFAARLWKKMQRRSLKEFSFAYDIVREKTADDGANELIELKLIEVGPTLKGANPDTQLLGVKAGRVLSSKNESKLRDAVKMISEVLSAVEKEDADEDTEEEKSKEKADEPGTVKADEPTTMNPQDVRLLADLIEA